MKLSYSRLRERHCKWNSCDVLSNSADNLRKHLSEHERQQYTQKVWCILSRYDLFTQIVLVLRVLVASMRAAVYEPGRVSDTYRKPCSKSNVLPLQE